MHQFSRISLCRGVVLGLFTFCALTLALASVSTAEAAEMKKITLSDARVYMPANHVDMKAMQIHSKEVSGCESFTVGISHYLPGGASLKSTPATERVYLVLAGELTVTSGNETLVIGPMESIYIPPNIERETVNNGRMPVTMVVIQP